MPKVISADFITSVFDLRRLPTDGLNEVAVVGRSNVGKSSLINALCQRKSLAQTGKTPGRTKAFNFFRVSLADDPPAEERRQGFLVDLPGYGFAKVSKKERESWPKMIEGYLLERTQLALVLLLIDCRREPQNEEQWIAELGQAGGLVVVLTKADKISKSDLGQKRTSIAKKLLVQRSAVIGVSTAQGKGTGLDQLRQCVYSAFQ